jgi:hypothetical protein
LFASESASRVGSITERVTTLKRTTTSTGTPFVSLLDAPYQDSEIN